MILNFNNYSLIPFDEQVVDVKTGHVLGPNEDGELLFRSQQNMLGYGKNADATRNTIDSEGWLRSGMSWHFQYLCTTSLQYAT